MTNNYLASEVRSLKFRRKTRPPSTLQPHELQELERTKELRQTISTISLAVSRINVYALSGERY